MSGLFEGGTNVPKHVGVVKDHTFRLFITYALSWFYKLILSNMHGRDNLKNVFKYYPVEQSYE
jgi:hypothetical protein